MSSDGGSRHERGVTALQMVVVLGPVVLLLMGFALDLGQLYVAKGELKTAANAMAAAAAGQLAGTDASIDNATASAQLTIANGSALSNQYNFGSLPIGQQTGSLVSTAADPTYYSAVADAIGTGNSDNTAAGSLARYAKVMLTGEVPLTFWGLVPIAASLKTTVAAQAVAGMSPPLCVACGIQPFAVAPIDASDSADFGYTVGTQYTLAFLCTGAPSPAALPGTATVVSYVILNRYDLNTAILPSEDDQLFRYAAQGLAGSTTPGQSCFTVNNAEILWSSATVQACTQTRVAPSVTDALCGLNTVFDASPPGACAGIANIDTLATIYSPDSDVSLVTDYTQYMGNGRRVITIPVIDTLNPTGSMTVLGFRQFLVEPNQNASDISPNDTFGRFGALYIGSVVPVKQGRFDGCQQTAGPGKVVIHQ